MHFQGKALPDRCQPSAALQKIVHEALARRAGTPEGEMTGGTLSLNDEDREMFKALECDTEKDEGRTFEYGPRA